MILVGFVLNNMIIIVLGLIIVLARGILLGLCSLLLCLWLVLDGLVWSLSLPPLLYYIMILINSQLISHLGTPPLTTWKDFVFLDAFLSIKSLLSFSSRYSCFVLCKLEIC